LFLERSLEVLRVASEVVSVHHHLSMKRTNNESDGVVVAEVVGSGYLIVLGRVDIFVRHRVFGCVRVFGVRHVFRLDILELIWTLVDDARGERVFGGVVGGRSARPTRSQER